MESFISSIMPGQGNGYIGKLVSFSLTSRMGMLELLSSALLLPSLSLAMVCVHQPEWNASLSTITFAGGEEEAAINPHTGQFTAEVAGWHHYTVAATVGGMLPPKPGDHLLLPSPTFAQVFLSHNGQVRPTGEEHGSLPYLLVTEDEVAAMEDAVFMEVGDTLELVTGHVTVEKASRNVYARSTEMIPGGFLENISFCVFQPTPGR